MKRILWIFVLAVLTSLLTGCGDSVGNKTVKVSYPYPGDTEMWQHIFAVDEGYKFKSAPLGVIVPHHLIAASEIAKFYDGLSKVTTPSTIFIIGPNHFETGKSDIQTCKNCVFLTSEGDVELDDDYVSKLVDSKIASAFDETFLAEHAIFSHTPYIKHYFPNAKIVPIVLQWKIPTDKVIKLADWLNENVPGDDLVIASVDFSHYQPEEVAEFHDQSSFSTISNLDFDNIYDLELDSPSSVYAVLNLMVKRGYMKAERFAYTNLAQFVTSHTEETTSHQFFGFFKDKVNVSKGVGILSFGNIPNDGSLNFSTGWDWDRSYDEQNDRTIQKSLRDIKGKEDRFLTGSDFLVFDLADSECRLENQNGMKVSFCKFTEDSKKEKEYLKTIESQDADIVYLLFQFQGSDELSEARKSLIRDFVKNGVDVFVGRGLKNVVPFENYKGGLIFYSLGDFIVDNKLATELTSTSRGIVLGLYITPTDYYIYTFPVDITNGYPKLTDYSKRFSAFLSFASMASLPKSAKLDEKKGTIKIER